MRIVDISGPIEDNMWAYGDPYPTPRIEQIPPPAWLDYPVYSQTVSFAVQSGTYLETAAHMDPTRMPIDQLPLARCYMIDAVAFWIPKAANEAITVDDLIQAEQRLGVTVQPGDALLVGTGWDKQWHAPNYVTDMSLSRPISWRRRLIGSWIGKSRCWAATRRAMTARTIPKISSPNSFRPRFYS